MIIYFLTIVLADSFVFYVRPAVQFILVFYMVILYCIGCKCCFCKHEYWVHCVA